MEEHDAHGREANSDIDANEYPSVKPILEIAVRKRNAAPVATG